MTVLMREVIGDVLRRARIAQGRTLREVSDSARVSLGYLSEVERGRKEPSSELLGSICGALDIPLSRVLLDAGDRLQRAERPADARLAAVGTAGTANIAAGITNIAAGTANIDVSTKVIIPPVTAMAVA